VVLGVVESGNANGTEDDASTNTEIEAGSLPEMEGVDFGGREIPFLLESGTNRAATHHLIKHHNGEPKSLSAPVVDGKSSSLLEYMLAVPEDTRHAKLRQIFPESPVHSRREIGDEAKADPHKGPRLSSLLELSVISSVALVIIAAFHASLVRLEAFGQYVSVGYGGQPFIEGGIVGFLRGAASSAPLEALYAHSTMASAACGLSVAGASFLLRRAGLERRGRYEALARFSESEEWRAHVIGEDKPSSTIVRPAELVEAAIAGVVAYIALRLLVALVGGFQDVLSFVGVEVGVFAAESERTVFYGAFAFGLFVLWRRVSARRLRLRISRGKV
jgi:hypothetical protein